MKSLFSLDSHPETIKKYKEIIRNYVAKSVWSSQNTNDKSENIFKLY